jgi:8-oxo-dGTP pyrophosphatase MutT (NUDIX family)
MTPIPAAAVAFVRDTQLGIEIYLCRRPAHFRYYPGAFVFPGGRQDEDDGDLRETARREVREEVGIEIDPQLLVALRDTHTNPMAGPIYHLVTFAYPIVERPETSVNVEEVDEEVWMSAGEALARLYLPYQIKAAIYTIAQFPTVSELLLALAGGSINENYRI